MSWITERATLIDDAFKAHELFAELIVKRANVTPENPYVARFAIGQAGGPEITFKHIEITLEFRPVINSCKRPAMEYNFSVMWPSSTVDLGTLYLLADEAAFFLEPLGNTSSIGDVNKVRTIDAIGGWLCDRIEDEGLLRPRADQVGSVA